MQKQRLLAVLLTISALLLSGCSTTKVVYALPTFEVPSPPQLPVVIYTVDTGKMCADLDNARKAYSRDRLLQEDSRMLRALLIDLQARFKRE